MKKFLMKTGCDKCYSVIIVNDNDRKQDCTQCKRDKLVAKQIVNEESKWEIVRCTVDFDYVIEQCTFSKSSCQGENCKNAHNRVEFQIWLEAREHLLSTLSDFFLDFIESHMYAEILLQYFIATEGYSVQLLCKQCLQEGNFESASKKRHKPLCKNEHNWDNVCLSFISEDNHGQKRHWFGNADLAPVGSKHYMESITVCINEMEKNMPSDKIFTLAKKVSHNSERYKTREKSSANNEALVEITTMTDEERDINDALFDNINDFNECSDDDDSDADFNSDCDEMKNLNNENYGDIYYKTIPANEAFEKKEENPENFKLCRVKLDGIYDTIATPIDENFPSILIRGRMNCGPCFEGDEVIVELLQVKKLDSDRHISEFEITANQLNSTEVLAKKNSETTTIQRGKVISVVKKARKRQGSKFICTVDDYVSNLVKPLCGTVPKVHLVNGALRKTFNEDDINNYVGLYTMEKNNLKLKKIVKLNDKNRQDKLFVVCYIKWSKIHMYPLGYATSCLSQGTDLASNQRIIDYACHVPKRYPQDTLLKMEINFSDVISNISCSREDLREEYVVTIDPPDCRDIDDALSIQQKDDHYIIGVHIADVSFFVPKGSKLDREAFERCRTFYPKVKEGPIHMLPAELSQNYCSLLPNRDRPCISVILSIDFNGNLLDSKITRTLIHSKKKLSYSDVQKIIFSPNSVATESDELRIMLMQLNTVAQLLRKKRLGKSLHFFQFENSISSNDGHNFAAHFLVEEFMILANTCVAEHLCKIFPYCTPLRMQGRPDDEEFDEWIKSYPYSSNIASFIQRYLPSESTFFGDSNSCDQSHSHVPLLKEMGQMLIEALQQKNAQRIREILGAEAFHPLHAIALNDWFEIQRHAEFICTGTSKLSNHGHFSLGKQCYTQFTSPIRRYMDIVVHRLVVASLLDPASLVYSKDEILKICQRVNLCASSAKKYEKFSNSLAAAAFLLSDPTFFAGILVDIDKNNLCFSFPELPELKQGQKKITFSNLDVCERPFHPEKRGVDDNTIIKDETQIIFKWNRRIYDVDYLAKVGRLKSDAKDPVCLSRNYHVRKVPLKTWLQVVAALDSQSNERLIEEVKQVIPFLKQYPDCPEVTSEMKESKIVHHHVPFKLQLEKAATLHVQFGAESFRGILQPAITMLNLTPEYSICIQHMNDAIKCFSDIAVKAVKDQYDSVEEYQNIWQPIIDMEAAYAAVKDADPVTIRNVSVYLQESDNLPNQYCGQLSLNIMFCKERCINLLRNSKDAEEDMHDYLCLKFPLNPRHYDRSMVKENTWVCHALAQHGAVSDDNSESSNIDSDQICVDFFVHHFNTEPPKELLGNSQLKCTVELLSKPLPHRLVTIC